jgi:replicative DNA helicase
MRSEQLERAALSTLFYFQDLMNEKVDPIDPDLFTTAGFKTVAQAIEEHGAHQLLVFEEVKQDPTALDVLLSIVSNYVEQSVTLGDLETKVIEPLKMLKFGRGLELAARESIAFVKNKEPIRAAQLLKERIEEEQDKTESKHFKTALRGSFEYLELLEKLLGPGEMDERVKTGIPLIDSVMNSSIGGGLHEGQLATIAARPGRGKSTVMMWIVSHILETSPKEKIGLFSFEMTARDIAKKLIDSAIGRKGRSVTMNPRYAGAASSAIADNEEPFNRVLIDERSGIEIPDILRSADEMSRQGVRVFFMDYIQRVKVGDVNPEALRVAFSEVVEALTQDAKRNGRIWILLSQFSRAAEGRPGTMADLKETSALEENSFFVWGLHRPTIVENGVQKLASNRLEIHVLKNRFGEVGGVYPFRVNWAAGTFEALGA